MIEHHPLTITLTAPQGTEVVTTQTLWEYLQSGGPVMVPLVLCSVVAMAFAMERYLRLRRRVVCPTGVADAVQLVHDGRVDEAIHAAEAASSPGGRILLAGLRRSGFSIEDIERAIEDQGQKEMQRLQAPVRGLSLIANVSPLLGLLGTVIGIAEAFHRVVDSGLGKPEHLAVGIEQALTTTVVGLVIAIPAMLVAAHLHAKVRRLMLHTDETIAPVVEPLARLRDEESHAA